VLTAADFSPTAGSLGRAHPLLLPIHADFLWKRADGNTETGSPSNVLEALARGRGLLLA
jgi:hypothetical protein